MGNWFVVALAFLSPVGAGYGAMAVFRLYREIIRDDSGVKRMREVALNLKQAFQVFRHAQGRTFAAFFAVISLGLLLLLGGGAALSFLCGALMVLLIGSLSAELANYASVAVALRAMERKPGEALVVAFYGGAASGLLVSCFSLLGFGLLFCYFAWESLHGGTPSLQFILSFALGVTLASAFSQVSSGVFSLAVVEMHRGQGRMETDEENNITEESAVIRLISTTFDEVSAKTIDLFDTAVIAVVATMVCAMVLPTTALSKTTSFDGSDEALYRLALAGAPLVLLFLGIMSALLGLSAIGQLKEREPRLALRQTAFISTGAFLITSFLFLLLSSLKLILWAAVFSGAVGAILVGLAVEQASERKQAEPHCLRFFIDIFASLGLPALIVATSVVVAAWAGGVYGIALCAAGIISGVSSVMGVHAYQVVTDNSAKLAVLSDLGEEVRKVIDRLRLFAGGAKLFGRTFASYAAVFAGLPLVMASFQYLFLDGQNTIQFRPTVFGFLLSPGFLGVFLALGFSRAAKIASAVKREYNGDSLGEEKPLSQELTWRKFLSVVKRWGERSSRAAVSSIVLLLVAPLFLGKISLSGSEAILGLSAGLIGLGLILPIPLLVAVMPNAKGVVQCERSGERWTVFLEQVSVAAEIIRRSTGILIKSISVLTLVISLFL